MNGHKAGVALSKDHLSQESQESQETPPTGNVGGWVGRLVVLGFSYLLLWSVGGYDVGWEAG